MTLVVALLFATLKFGFPCDPPLQTVFIRHSGLVKMKAVIVAKLDMATCALHCRRNSNPATDEDLLCGGFNFHAGRNPTCEFFVPSESLPVDEKPLSYYFEKTCARIPRRCEESAFLVDSRKGIHVIPSGENRLARTRQECVEACMDEDCASFEWNESERSCTVSHRMKSDATSIIRDEKIEFFENNCLSPDARCPGGRVDFLIVRRSDVPSFGVSVGIRSIRDCMRECITATLFHCRSFQYDPVSSECFVSDESSDVAVPSQSLDLYEPFCARRPVSGQCNMPYAFEKLLTTIATGADNIGMMSNATVADCIASCAGDCKAFNYDVTSHTCYLLDGARPNVVIGPNENFDYYEMACPEEDSLEATPEEFVDFPMPFPTLTPEDSRILEKDQIEESIFQNTRNEDETRLNSQETNDLDEENIFASFDDDIFPTTSAEEAVTTTSTTTTTTTSMTPTTSTTTDRVIHEEPEMQLGNRRESSEYWDTGSEPKLLPASKGIGYVDPRHIRVDAECSERGVNVSVNIARERYTGAIYATERFEQCRVFADDVSAFAIFVPRPSHNTWCNAFETDGVLSTVLVMSNDRVVPFDVTTPEDLFFHVTCNYSADSVSVRKGLVIGGPVPVPISSSQGEGNRRMSLQITRKGKPVSNVFIGEQLVARVDSDLPGASIRVVDCTAYRVGGGASVRLIADGCALLPALMTAMVLSPRGWESTLSAFRIDDAAQVDIVCMVSVCGSSCSQDNTCPNPPRPARSLNDVDAIRVDRRISIHGAAGGTHGVLPAVCVHPSVYLCVVALLAISLVSAFGALGYIFFTRRGDPNSVRDVSMSYRTTETL